MSLPKGFKRLEYIESTGTQYVDSGIKGSQNTRVDADYETTATAGAIIGADTKWGSNMFTIEVHFAAFATTNYHHATVPSGRHTVSLNKGVFSLDGTVLSTMTGTFTTPVNMTLFVLNRNGSLAEYGTLKLYSMQIYDNGTLVRDFIPCQNASGAVGLWDAVNEEFYGNAGTGTFTAGPVVPEIVDESEITELEYIQSSGTQLFETGFTPNQDTRVVMDFDLTSVSSEGWATLFATRTNNEAVNAFALFSNKTFSAAYEQYATQTLQPAVSLKGRHVVDKNKNVTSLDGTVISTFTYEAFTGDAPLRLLWESSATPQNKYPFIGNLYYCQAYDNGLLERDYIPAMLANGEVGLYDRVFHAFYRNAGTGEFTAGPEAATAPKAPANFRVESETDTLVTLAWDASDKAIGYRLYRSRQLLAETEETSVAVAVEPFAGAVFTLTAYNENGEGAAAELPYFNAPEDPILFLVTDRTQQDVTERNPKGYYAASDLNRVGYAMDYLANIIRGYGYTLEVHTKTDWTDEDWKLTGEMVKYLQSLNNLKSVFSTLVELPETMEKIDYQDANNIELLLLTIDETVARVVAGFTRANAYGLRSGAKGLPASQSDRGRNWGQLDAMETTWANWQLATWYLLLYGNLKAEGVVE